MSPQGSSVTVVKVVEALVAGIEEAIASELLSDGDVIEVLEALQMELDGMLERETREIGEVEDEV